MPAAAWMLTATLAVACGGGSDAGSAATAGGDAGTTAAAASRPLAPLLFNVSAGGSAGDVISLQGTGFGDRPTVRLQVPGAAPQELAVLNRVGDGYLAVELPAKVPATATLTVSNAGIDSAPWRLNAARPMHLDTTLIVPGGPFRIVGRNLLLPGAPPRVIVDGQVANVDLTASQEQFLAVVAPPGLRTGAQVAVSVDNGSGPMALDQTVSVGEGSTDPFGSGVGWASAFGAIATRVYDAATDPRLPERVVCDGSVDDSRALQSALRHVSRNGGGVITLPVGACRIHGSLKVESGTVLQGAGRDRTLLMAEADSALWTSGADLVAIRGLSLRSVAAGASSSLNLKHSRRVLLQDLAVDEGEAATAWMYGNENLAVFDCAFSQRGATGSPGAVHAADNRGFVFRRNDVRFVHGTGTSLDAVRDAWIEGNRWTRDAARQAESGVVHGVTVNFARRIALVGNSFVTVNGPVDQRRNDGEALLTEGGGAERTESLGTVAAATATTLSDPTARLPARLSGAGPLPDNYGIVIVAGRGAGQARRVAGFAAGVFSVDPPWDQVPDTSSRYASAQWGLEKALVKGNTFSQNPRGIWLYSTAVRDVDIADNTLEENGGILARAFQRLDAGWFSPVIGVRVVGNTVRNSGRLFQSYIAVHFANADGQPFGTSHIGVEVRANALTANWPNTDGTSFMGPAGREGFMTQMNVEAADATVPRRPALLGTVLQSNRCERCATAFRLGTGAEGTVLVDNLLVDSPSLWTNTATVPGAAAAIGTYVR